MYGLKEPFEGLVLVLSFTVTLVTADLLKALSKILSKSNLMPFLSLIALSFIAFCSSRRRLKKFDTLAALGLNLSDA